MSAPAATAAAPSPQSSFALEWKERIAALKGSDLARRLEAAAMVRSLGASDAESKAVPMEMQANLVNALLHWLHAKPAAAAAPAVNAEDPVNIALSTLSTLLSTPSLIDRRAQMVIVRKLQQLAPTSAAASQIERILAAHADLIGAVRDADAAAVAGSAASADAASSSAPDRAALRQAKMLRVQQEAAEKRRLKAESAGAGASSGSSAAASASAAAAAPSQFDVSDGTESAPFGNFHNYYVHNPTQERLQFIPKSIGVEIVAAKQAQQQAGHSQFAFLDVGCNEGDLTIGLMKHVLDGFEAAASSSGSASAPPSTQIHALGIDIDPELISRACGKVDSASVTVRDELAKSKSSFLVPGLRFEQCDVMKPDAVEQVLLMLQGSITQAGGSSAGSASSSSVAASPSPFPFDLVCCYSITLWIHIHGGDSGLRLFLSKLAALTSNLILEPQPWSCYKNARERWRRTGHADPPKMKELQWRVDVSDRIIEFVTSPQVGMRLRKELGSTKWGRRVLWFDRGASE